MKKSDQTPNSDYLVPFDGSFKLKNTQTKPPKDTPDKAKVEKKLKKVVKELNKLQDVLYAHDKYSVLCVFQAMDAAGKDSTIRAVTTGINPAGFQVFSFKSPSAQELDHDFLWRTSTCLPERGRIGIFNRSYYEEALVVRVHPEYLAGQKLPDFENCKQFWKERFDSIREHERHLARNGTVILKFWLNVSQEEQHNRFLRRLERPDKNWKFSKGDLAESQLWDQYMDAYEAALRETSRPWAPWFAIPADDKPYMRLTTAEIIAQQLKSLGLKYPELSKKERAELEDLKAELKSKSE